MLAVVGSELVLILHRSRRWTGFGLALQGGSRGEQKKRSVPAVDDKRMRALAAAMVRESERETLQGIRLELEQVRVLAAEAPVPSGCVKLATFGEALAYRSRLAHNHESSSSLQTSTRPWHDWGYLEAVCGAAATSMIALRRMTRLVQGAV